MFMRYLIPYCAIILSSSLFAKELVQCVNKSILMPQKLNPYGPARCEGTDFSYSIDSTLVTDFKCETLKKIESGHQKVAEFYSFFSNEIKIKKSINLRDAFSSADGIIIIPISKYILDGKKMSLENLNSVWIHEISHHYFNKYLDQNFVAASDYISLFQKRSELLLESKAYLNLPKKIDIICVVENNLQEELESIYQKIDIISDELQKINGNTFVDSFAVFWAPYHELVADFLTVLITDDLDTNKNAVAHSKSPVRWIEKGRLRSFYEKVEIAEVEKESDFHVQLSPVRSLLGEFLQKNEIRSIREKKILFHSVIEVISQHMNESYHTFGRFNVKRDNTQLIEKIKKVLNII